MTLVGWVLFIFGLLIAFGNLTGGGLAHREGANGRLIVAIVLAAIGAWLIWGR